MSPLAFYLFLAVYNPQSNALQSVETTLFSTREACLMAKENTDLLTGQRDDRRTLVSFCLSALEGDVVPVSPSS